MRGTFGILAATVFALGLQTQSVQALPAAMVTWVSSTGDDTKNCTRPAPCSTLSGALSKTAFNGIVVVIDTGSFGGATITSPVSIVADGVTASVLFSTIKVNLSDPNYKVTLKGLDFAGVGTGQAGVVMLGKGKLTVIDCTIRDGSVGIDVNGAAGARVFVDRTSILNTTGIGIQVHGANGAPNVAFVQRSLIDGSGGAGVQVENASTVVLSDNTISGSGGADLAPLNGGQAISYGNNLIRSGAPTQTQMLK